MDSRIPYVPDVIVAILITAIVGITMIVLFINIVKIIGWVQGLPFDG